MELISFGYDDDFNLLPQFAVLIELHTLKSLTLYQLETVPLKDNSSEANSYIWANPSEDYLAMTDENYISLSTPEFTKCKHIGHEYFSDNFSNNTILLKSMNQ